MILTCETKGISVCSTERVLISSPESKFVFPHGDEAIPAELSFQHHPPSCLTLKNHDAQKTAPRGSAPFLSRLQSVFSPAFPHSAVLIERVLGRTRCLVWARWPRAADVRAVYCSTPLWATTRTHSGSRGFSSTDLCASIQMFPHTQLRNKTPADVTSA